MEQEVTIEKISETELNKVTTTKEKVNIEDLRNQVKGIDEKIAMKQSDIQTIQNIIADLESNKNDIQTLITQFETAPIAQ